MLIYMKTKRDNKLKNVSASIAKIESHDPEPEKMQRLSMTRALRKQVPP